MTDIGRTLAQLEKRLSAVERTARLSSASLDDTALEVRDGAGSLRALVGQQGDGTTAVNIVNGGPPPTPATPTASPALGGVAAGWDGRFTDGVVMPLDWARVEVHASPTASFVPGPDTLKATIETPQGGVVYIPSTAPLYVTLVARNTSGAASPATPQVGPYAPKPVAGEIGIGQITETLIADGAVTTPKVFANAVTTAKLAAGSVDAVALKADAITGKTITGGTINGAEFHSDDGAGGLVDISAGTVETTAANGWKIVIDPTQALPVIDLLDNTGATAGSINGTGDPARPGLNVSSGPFADGAINDWRWVTHCGADGPTANGWKTVRVRESDSSVFSGGYLSLEPARSILAVVNSATPASNTLFQIDPGLFTLDEGRVLIDPPASSSSALLITTKTGHTGYLIRAQLNGADRFIVTPAGAIAATGSIAATSGILSTDLTIAGISQGRGYAAFQARDTPTGTTITTSEQIALTQTGVTIKRDRAYRISVRGLARNDTANTGVRVRVRKTNASGAIWLDTFTVTTPSANANYQYANDQIIINDSGADITTTLVMTWVSVAGGNSFLNTGLGFYTAFEVLDVGAMANFPTAQSVT
ncbi:hypothetical protein [Streptomyces sp. ML-6]|uniref:hypothetical protein n=1 Tax=Streptomyces sp. ML-6 TaxID=2982693 RepID=UPI0024BF6F5B|nr:hypothetical protein [Streptomyces sp. ML-6]MDK0525014.1 hypothetical protein [Streptomyces sp. ML-6]